jgi:hypothetical protein
VVVGRDTPPELVLYGGAVWGTTVKVIVRERRRVTTLGVAVARIYGGSSDVELTLEADISLTVSWAASFSSDWYLASQG